ncbi:MAG TPA: rRNA pseudouridine synthase, partial [Aequorivita sp.]|nr:rRNA pseudouridine synthase [Aequorivita sp.]
MSAQDNYDRGRGSNKPGKNARKKSMARGNAPLKSESPNRNTGRQQDPAKPKLKFDKTGKEIGRREKPVREVKKSNPEDGIRLNKYIANSGVCSRREADT